MKPSIGRSVHFTSISGHCQHAVILDVVAPEPGTVVLEVHPAYDDMYRTRAMCSGSHSQQGWWHWPERVEEKPAVDVYAARRVPMDPNMTPADAEKIAQKLRVTKEAQLAVRGCEKCGGEVFAYGDVWLHRSALEQDDHKVAL